MRRIGASSSFLAWAVDLHMVLGVAIMCIDQSDVFYTGINGVLASWRYGLLSCPLELCPLDIAK